MNGPHRAYRAHNWWKPLVEGAENLPDGPFILAVNRVGGFDHLLVTQAIGRPMTVVTSRGDGLLRIPTLATTGFGQAGRAASEEVLASGGIVLVFPERVCGNDGAVHRGTADTAAVAIGAEVPIVPAGLAPRTHRGSTRNLADAPARWAIGDLRYRLAIGKPILINRYLGLDEPGRVTDGLIMRGLVDSVMSRIAELANRRYVDTHSFDPDLRAANRNPVLNPVDPASLREWVTARRRMQRERRETQRQRMAAEAELARILDEQEAAEITAAQEAARRWAEGVESGGR
ncbi:hypothetical protein HMPREF1531_01901 [Propionibacterium sp. oral taxon 192 str. F0372]|nr:hypothetical protein HMPREF1531_01901 [Propionibacterium sp. oral taxon 192 str. F0372]